MVQAEHRLHSLLQAEHCRYELESEIAAIDRKIASLGVSLGGAISVGPGTEALSSKVRLGCEWKKGVG